MWLLDCSLTKCNSCDFFLYLSTQLFDISAIYESAFFLVVPFCLRINGLESIGLKASDAGADSVWMRLSQYLSPAILPSSALFYFSEVFYFILIQVILKWSFVTGVILSEKVKYQKFAIFWIPCSDY